MGNISQNMKAVITFGGDLDSSWKRSSSDLQKSIKNIGRQSEKLTREQSKLSGEIKKTALSGQKLGDLKRRYRDISREIKQTGSEQKRLNDQLQKTQRMQLFKSAGKGLFRRGLSLAAQTGAVLPGMLAGGGGLLASLTGLLISPVATNARTAARAGMAGRYGVDVPVFNQWDSLVRPYGMSGEDIGTLFSAYRKKAGEYKQTGKQSSLQKAFETLGFGAGDFAGMNDMEQFSKILERALALPDQTKASFAMTTLLGNEAGKLLALMKQTGKSYRDLMDEQSRYNLVTREGAEGAVAGNQAITDLQTLFSSAIAEISGQLGSQLAPDIRRLTDDLSGWFRSGGLEKVATFLRQDLYPGVLSFGQGIVYVGKIAWAVARKLSWLLPDETADKQNIIRSIGQGDPLAMVRFRADKTGLGDWFSKTIDSPETLENIRRQWQQAESDAGFWKSHLPGDFQENTSRRILSSLEDEAAPDFSSPDKWFRPAPRTNNSQQDPAGLWNKLNGTDISQMPVSQQVTDNRRFDFTIEVNAAPGQSPRNIADEVISRAQEKMVFDGNNRLTDGGISW